MGNFCSAVPVAVDTVEVRERPGRLDLIGQLSYDIYKIQGDPDWKDDLDEDDSSRRHSKRYYEVRKSPISRVYSQVSSFRAAPSAGMSATSSNWTRSQKPSSISTELTNSLERLVHAQLQYRAKTSTPSSPESESSSGSSTFESIYSNHVSPTAELELRAEPRATPPRVQKSVRTKPGIKRPIRS